MSSDKSMGSVHELIFRDAYKTSSSSTYGLSANGAAWVTHVWLILVEGNVRPARKGAQGDISDRSKPIAFDRWRMEGSTNGLPLRVETLRGSSGCAGSARELSISALLAPRR
jgi:hypothetical protein